MLSTSGDDFVLLDGEAAVRKRAKGNEPSDTFVGASREMDQAAATAADANGGSGGNAIRSEVQSVRPLGKVLLCGWRQGLAGLIHLLDRQLAFGSEVHVLSDFPLSHRNKWLVDEGMDFDAIRNLRLVHHQVNSFVAQPWRNRELGRSMPSCLRRDAEVGDGALQGSPFDVKELEALPVEEFDRGTRLIRARSLSCCSCASTQQWRLGLGTGRAQ